MRASRSFSRRTRKCCPTHSRTRPCASSSKTSCSFARSPGRRLNRPDRAPDASSRARKAARPPKRPPPGAPQETERARCDDPAPGELIQGIDQFNRGEFFEQHETIELLWRATPGPIRGMYHGILQIGVGFHHWRRANYHGATVLLEEGIERLRPFAPTCQRVDVARLIAEATAARERLLALGPSRMSDYDIANAPRVHFVR
ncbi:MAG: DUF309 domain-containing protein [Chloroflexi bacterium]|nr:MAG: DUF309 domain-containing protein [Chloroflexota bacterium]